jgi:membrane-associated phospholipid phosphatase
MTKKSIAKFIKLDHPLFLHYLSIVIAIVVFVLSISVFIDLTGELAEQELKPFDDHWSAYIQSFRTENLTACLTVITHLGSKITYIVVISLLIIISFLKKIGWNYILQVTVVLILSSLTNVLLKDIINRPRPTLEHLVQVTSSSYPSGHSMSAMAFYGFIFYLILRFKKNDLLKVVFSFLCVLMIILIGLSRIYLGVHYPSDVLGGWVAGLLWITLCIVIFNFLDIHKTKKIYQS